MVTLLTCSRTHFVSRAPNKAWLKFAGDSGSAVTLLHGGTRPTGIRSAKKQFVWAFGLKAPIGRQDRDHTEFSFLAA